MKYEMYYNSGGHGGPYSDLIMAEQRARDLIKGDKSGKTTSIEIRPHNSKAIGGYSANNKGSIYIETKVHKEEFTTVEKRAVYLN